MRKLFSLLAVSLALLCGAPATAENDWSVGERYALIVGIDDYQNEQVVDLRYAAADAELFKQALVQNGDFEEDNIFLLSSRSQDESLKPSLTNVVFRLEWFRDVLSPGDTLVFYFAGHGVSFDEETYLLTEEADERSKNTLMVSSLRGGILYDLLDAAGAQNTLVVLDACRNDPTAGRGDANNTLSESLARGLTFVPKKPGVKGLEKNTATLFACSQGERSWEWDQKKHGFFTYYLVEALKDGGYGEDGLASLSGVASYVRDNVTQSAHRWANNKQTPMLRYEGPDPQTWFLASRGPGAPPAGSTVAQQDRALLIARAETAEREARKAQASVEELEARKAVDEAEKEVLKRKNQLLETQNGGGDLEKAKLELELAEDNLKLAQEGAQASAVRLAASERSYTEAQLKLETSKLAKEVSNMSFGHEGSSPELEDLQRKLEELQGALVKLDTEKRQAVERALLAERQVRTLEAQLAKKWEGRALGKRPTRRTKREDLWRVVDPGAEEATSL